jgi:very-short-patch-repair endonuclease
MDVATVLAQCGGSGRWGELRPVVRRRQLRRAVAEGAIIRLGRGRYGLSSLAAARVTAESLTATASHLTAALHWGWAVKHEPETAHVTLPRGRKLREPARTGVRRHWRDLAGDEIVDGWVTTPARTVIDCCLDLPFDEALAVADSSWRAGLSPLVVRDLALRLPPRSRRKVGRVLQHVYRGAANPFESVLRALCLQVDGLGVVTQHVIKGRGFFAQVDLADQSLRIVIEAEGFDNHGTRRALRRDCRRYTGLGARGWVVLRFTWDEVMFDPDYVLAALRETVAVRRPTATNLPAA